ncbi:hypothetical protein FMUBM48_08360 [Nocardia cyriacigeorgica]|nr:hypothetical protein FMUBM48_08360 [Nocardia cyriacigeorgica]
MELLKRIPADRLRSRLWRGGCRVRCLAGSASGGAPDCALGYLGVVVAHGDRGRSGAAEVGQIQTDGSLSARTTPGVAANTTSFTLYGAPVTPWRACGRGQATAPRTVEFGGRRHGRKINVLQRYHRLMTINRAFGVGW